MSTQEIAGFTRNTSRENAEREAVRINAWMKKGETLENKKPAVRVVRLFLREYICHFRDYGCGCHYCGGAG